MSDAAYLQFDGTDLYFEAVLSESAEHMVTATEHVVEEGANITDHVRENPRRVTLEVFLSNTPITVAGPLDMQITFETLDVPKRESNGPIGITPGALIQAGAAAISNLLNGAKTYRAAVLKAQAPGPKVVREVMQLLEGWQSSKTLGKVYLPWRTYESMIIEKLTPTRDPTTGDAAKVSIEFREIRLVEARLVSAPKPTEIRGKKAVSKGRQSTTFARDPGPKKSILSSILGRGG